MSLPIIPPMRQAPSGVECIPERRRRLYLAELSKGNTVGAACKAAGISYHQVRWARSRGLIDPEEEAAAYAEGNSHLEQEALRRGRDGVLEVQMHGGQVCYQREVRTEVDALTGETQEVLGPVVRDAAGEPVPIAKRVYSDSLLKFVLGARDPARYRDQRHEVTGAGGGPVDHNIVVEFVE